MGRKRGTVLILVALVAGLTVTTASASPVPEQPANDDFAAAKPIDQLPYSDIVDNTLATTEVAEPSECGVDAHTVWYRLDVESAARLIVHTFGSDFSREFAVYRGTSMDSLDTVSCWAKAIDVEPGTYWIQAGSRVVGSTGEIRVAVEPPLSMSGSVVGPDGQPLGEICISARLSSGATGGSTRSAADGSWRIDDLREEDYRLLLIDCSTSRPRFPPQWHDGALEDAASMYDVEPVRVRHNQLIPELSLRVDRFYESISGTVTDEFDVPLEGVCVKAEDSAGKVVVSKHTAGDGSYTLFTQQGTFTVSFAHCSNAMFVPTWYLASSTRDGAQAIEVGPDQAVTGIDAVLTRTTQPTNDAFSGAIALDTSQEIELFTRLATLEAGEPDDCPLGDASVWYSWTAPQDSAVMARLHGYGAVHLYRAAGEGIEDLVTLKCGPWLQPRYGPSEAIAYVDAGDTVYVQLASWSSYNDIQRLSFAGMSPSVSTLLDAPVPCAAACPELRSRRSACDPHPLTPPGSYHDVVVQLSETDNALVATMDPGDGDADFMVCRTTPVDDSYLVARASGPWSCRDGLGCVEQVVVEVEPGETLVLRVYNWLDAPEPFLRYGTGRMP